MKNLSQYISLWFGAIMVLLVISGAIAIVFTDFLSERLYGNKRTIFVFILLAYAVYRSFRIYLILSKKSKSTSA
ncbi:MAG: hypothetical protein IPM51_15695 [Sphingobacteriaceae bacterium]|nr:hypothetical protein [Sphingobacteriaceae bacterium]